MKSMPESSTATLRPCRRIRPRAAASPGLVDGLTEAARLGLVVQRGRVHLVPPERRHRDHIVAARRAPELRGVDRDRHDFAARVVRPSSLAPRPFAWATNSSCCAVTLADFAFCAAFPGALPSASAPSATDSAIAGSARRTSPRRCPSLRRGRSTPRARRHRLVIPRDDPGRRNRLGRVGRPCGRAPPKTSAGRTTMVTAPAMTARRRARMRILVRVPDITSRTPARRGLALGGPTLGSVPLAAMGMYSHRRMRDPPPCPRNGRPPRLAR